MAASLFLVDSRKKEKVEGERRVVQCVAQALVASTTDAVLPSGAYVLLVYLDIIRPKTSKNDSRFTGCQDSHLLTITKKNKLKYYPLVH